MQSESEEFTVSGSAAPSLASGKPGRGCRPTPNGRTVLDAVRRRIDATVQTLPNFVCPPPDRAIREAVSRLGGKGPASGGPVVRERRRKLPAGGGAKGIGQAGRRLFHRTIRGPALQNVFLPQSRTSFRLEGAEEIGGNVRPCGWPFGFRRRTSSFN